MTSDYLVHALNESKVPEWLLGEELAAAAFIAMAVLLVLEINVQTHYVFSRRQGTYFWAMQLGSIGCAVDALGLLIRY